MQPRDKDMEAEWQQAVKTTLIAFVISIGLGWIYRLIEYYYEMWLQSTGRANYVPRDGPEPIWETDSDTSSDEEDVHDEEDESNEEDEGYEEDESPAGAYPPEYEKHEY